MTFKLHFYETAWSRQLLGTVSTTLKFFTHNSLEFFLLEPGAALSFETPSKFAALAYSFIFLQVIEFSEAVNGYGGR
jgi:hypothetical protein